MRHGTRNAYMRHGCRCEACSTAHREAQRAYRDRKRGQEPPEHGTITGYDVYACRCAECSQVKMARRRQQRRLAASERG